MSFATTISALSSKVDGLIANRVAKFAYTQQAYNSDTVNGVENYDYAEEQNIPLGTTSVLKVNETILTKGWRTQASAITRMLMNHFLGRTSYNLNKTVDFLKGLMTAITDNMGVAEGFATLDANGRIPSSQLTEEVMEYKGEWDADTNIPELDEETGKKGNVYKVSVAGEQDLGEGEVFFRAGAYIMYNGTAWTRISGTEVAKVNNVTPDSVGNVTLTGEDIASSSVDNMSLANKIKLNLKRSFGYLLGRYFEKCTFPFATPSYETDFMFKNEKYFVSSPNGVKVSSDFKTWMDTNITNYCEIYFIKNTWVAIPRTSEAGNVKYSTDGLTWVDTDITNVTTRGSIETKDMIIACFTENANNNVYKTIDGINWTLVASSTTYKYFMFKGNRFFAESNDSIYTSSDGENWVQTDMLHKFASSEEKCMAYKEGTWVGIFVDMGICYSVDGIHWTRTSVTESGYNIVVYANGLFVAGASGRDINAKTIKTSSNGVTWSNVTAPSSFCRSIVTLFYANGIWLLLTTEPVIYCSLNGLNWFHSSLTSASLNSISYFNGVFVATASAQGVYVSTNGVDWTSTQRSTVFADKAISPVLRTKDLFLYDDGDITVTNPSYYISSLDILEEKGWINLD